MAFSLARLYPSAGVIRYAVGCLRKVEVETKSWGLIQRLLWQCIVGDPGAIRFVVDFVRITTGGGRSLAVDKDLAQDALDSRVVRSASVGHGNEVV